MYWWREGWWNKTSYHCFGVQFTGLEKLENNHPFHLPVIPGPLLALSQFCPSKSLFFNSSQPSILSICRPSLSIAGSFCVFCAPLFSLLLVCWEIKVVDERWFGGTGQPCSLWFLCKEEMPIWYCSEHTCWGNARKRNTKRAGGYNVLTQSSWSFSLKEDTVWCKENVRGKQYPILKIKDMFLLLHMCT